jgi:hypothetical protein
MIWGSEKHFNRRSKTVWKLKNHLKMRTSVPESRALMIKSPPLNEKSPSPRTKAEIVKPNMQNTPARNIKPNRALGERHAMRPFGYYSAAVSFRTE